MQQMILCLQSLIPQMLTATEIYLFWKYAVVYTWWKWPKSTHLTSQKQNSDSQSRKITQQHSFTKVTIKAESTDRWKK